MNVTDDKDRGLYEKFCVQRTDGTSELGGKHANCEYFVLDLDHDPHARPAIAAYANSCHEKFPKLAEDLRKKLAEKMQYALPHFSSQLSIALLELTDVRRRLAEAEAALARLHEHRIKTRAAADKRQREVGTDGLTIQLQSEAGLLDMLCGECPSAMTTPNTEPTTATNSCPKCGAEAVSTYAGGEIEYRCGTESLSEGIRESNTCRIRVLERQLEKIGIPCCRCGGRVNEFSVPNEVWNAVIRRGGPETDREYLCVWCYVHAVNDCIASAALWHDAPTVPGIWVFRPVGETHHMVVRLQIVSADRHFAPGKWFGPIPEVGE